MTSSKNLTIARKGLPKRKKHVTTLGEFIQAEMKKRDMSERQFAQFTGVASGTINAYINEKKIEPSLGTLKKLARACGVELTTLIDIAFPGEIHPTYSSDILLLAQELAILRKSHKAIYDVIITIMRGKTSPNNGK